MGVDPASGDAGAVPTSPIREFVRNYFELLHHPLEDEGVDFWWMDWQQGRTTADARSDPLTWLNHLHFDRHAAGGPAAVRSTSAAGAGSAATAIPSGSPATRSPLWGALAFQPRYTAAGRQRRLRLVEPRHRRPQSARTTPSSTCGGSSSAPSVPVLRLHSNNQDPASDRRPWAFGEEVLDVARDAFDLRYSTGPVPLHGRPDLGSTPACALVRPTSWVDPGARRAYLARDQYLLGADLLVAPVVRPADPTTGLADVDVWLPAGPWLDRATGESFTGPRWVRLGVPTSTGSRSSCGPARCCRSPRSTRTRRHPGPPHPRGPPRFPGRTRRHRQDLRRRRRGHRPRRRPVDRRHRRGPDPSRAVLTVAPASTGRTPCGCRSSSNPPTSCSTAYRSPPGRGRARP